MPSLIHRLQQDHINYSRLLNLLEAEADVLHAGGNASYPLIRDIITYMHEFPDVYHHPCEDFLFNYLLEVDQYWSTVVERLIQQHALVAGIAAELAEILAQPTPAPSPVQKQNILSRINDYLAIMRKHMLTEEKEIYPVLNAQLDQDVLENIRQQLAAVKDPVFGEKLREKYQRLLDSITRSKEQGEHLSPSG